MKFFSELKRVFKIQNICISERMNTVETLSPFIITKQQLPESVHLQSICASVPERDTLRITLTNVSGDILIISNDQSTTIDFSDLVDVMDLEDEIEVRVQIDKTVKENRFSIYDFESFTSDLLNNPLLDILKWFSGRLSSQDFLVFEVFDCDISFSTSTMAFVSNANSMFSPKSIRNQKLRDCKETAYFYNMNTFEVIPEDFKIEGIEQADNCLRPLFDRLTTILSLIYVASSASIVENNLNIQINGQRTVTYSFKIDTIKENFRWFSIYSWIFSDGNPTDKALIAHNVISLHCKYANLLDIDEKVFDSIKSNYNLYLRNNVDRYLDLKRDISKFIQNVVAQVGDYALSILNKFKTNLIAIFGFFFTVVLTRVGSTQKWDNIFSRDTIYIIELIVIGSLVYLGICFYEAHIKLSKAKQAYDALKKNYCEVLSEKEINEAFGDDKLMLRTELFARKRMIVWSAIWGVLLIIPVFIIEFLTVEKGVFVWLIDRLFG